MFVRRSQKKVMRVRIITCERKWMGYQNCRKQKNIASNWQGKMMENVFFTLKYYPFKVALEWSSNLSLIPTSFSLPNVLYQFLIYFIYWMTSFPCLGWKPTESRQLLIQWCTLNLQNCLAYSKHLKYICWKYKRMRNTIFKEAKSHTELELWDFPL